jgi:hypothetical protein
LETWVDVLGFLPRSYLAHLIPQIRDRKFASVLHFFLNKCGEVTLGWIHIKSSFSTYGPAIVQKNKDLFSIMFLRLAEEPIPPNVKNFRGMRLRFGHIFFKFYFSHYSVILILPYLIL